MKRYLLFCGSNYYPNGGMNDCDGSFDTIEEALEALNKKEWSKDWYHIVDRQTMEIVKD